MADYQGSMPVASKADLLDERVLVKIQDAADPSGVDKSMEVSEKKAHVRNHGKDSDGVDQEILLSQEGHQQANGKYDAALNKRPSSQGLIVSDRNAAPGEATMNLRPTAVAGEDDSVAQDVALRHSNGDSITPANPLSVSIEDSLGDEISDPATGANVVKDGTSTHNYTVTALKEFRDLSVECSSSGLAKFELSVETAPASGIFTRVDTKFNSVADPNVRLGLKRPRPVDAGVIIRVVKTNLDNGATDLYSTINGLEVTI